MRSLAIWSLGLTSLFGCNQEAPLSRECPAASSAPLSATDVSTYSGVTPDDLLSRLHATRTGTLESHADDPVVVSMAVTVTQTVLSAGTMEDVTTDAPEVVNANATEFCPAGDHLRIADVHLMMDVVPADGTDPFVVEIPDVEIRVYGPTDADIEMFSYEGHPITLPPVLQAAADANACGPNPVGRATISNLLTDPAPLFAFEIELLSDPCSESFLTYTPGP